MCFLQGVVHSEIPIKESIGFQLWVNLENKNKMIEPRYQEFKKDKIPVAEMEGVKVKVIAGEAFGVDYSIYIIFLIFYSKDSRTN